MKVLLVDDHLDTLEAFSELITFWGHQVRIVQDASLALEAALEDPPDLALIDLGMPQMEGCQIARQIRQHAGLDQTSLVAVTGRDSEEDRLRTRAAGFDLHLIKPLEPAQLKALLESPPARSTRPHPQPVG